MPEVWQFPTVSMGLGPLAAVMHARFWKYLQQRGQIQAFGFFSQILATTQAITDEGELLELFIQLSMTAFQGFQLDPVAATIVDDILLYAEQVSQTFSVDSDTVN